MKRYLEPFVLKDLKSKVVLLSGPRQVGKTTLSKQVGTNFAYLNFDVSEDREIISKKEWDRDRELIIFDELHKMKNWKSWIKGVYDKEGVNPALLVTGSARMDTFKKGGESLAGRHFYYRLHPVDVSEASLFMDSREALENIMKLGGFPEPFLKGSESFAKRWRRQHTDVIIRQDLLDLEKVREIKGIEIMVELLKNQVGSTVSYSSLAGDLQVSVPTVKFWLEILEKLFVIFPVRPYHKNIARAILKEPKYYFYDTGSVENGEAAALENAVACALIKKLHFLEDTQGCKTSLHFIKDKEKREVDFLTVVDGTVLQMIEVKLSDDNFSKNLFHFGSFFDESVKKYQIVHNLKMNKMKEDVRMIQAHEFLKDL
ncbi:MAG TPA: ATP-binding protein [bacterium]|nr:ATP-binding protein [bacterium]